MSAIQSAATSWIDSFAGQTGAQSGGKYQPAFNNDISNWGSSDSDTFTSVVSDTEEEGEMEETQQTSETADSFTDSIESTLEAGEPTVEAPAEQVAVVAAQIGLIEQSMRNHQATGQFNAQEKEEGNTYSAAKRDLNLVRKTVGGRSASVSVAAMASRTNRQSILKLLA